MVFAKALCVLFILSLTNSGDSQRLKNYDNSIVKRAKSKEESNNADEYGKSGSGSKQNIKGIDLVFSF